MAFNGTGTFIRLYNWVQDALNGIKIRADRMDAETDGIATGLSTCITRDGQSVPIDDIPMGGFKLTGLGNGAASTDGINYGQLTSTIAALKGFIYGLTLSTAGASATFAVAAGNSIDSTGALLMPFAAAMSKTTAAWVAGDTHGALDTGAITINTWYHVFEIGDALQTPDILISLSPTAPTLPAGYTLFRRIGSMKTNGSSQWTLFRQYGSYFYWDVALIDALNVVPGSTANFQLAMTVPSGINVLPIFDFENTPSAAGTVDFYGGDGGQSAVTSWPISESTGANVFSIISSLMTDTSQRLTFRVNTTVSARYSVFTKGWIDDRGRNF